MRSVRIAGRPTGVIGIVVAHKYVEEVRDGLLEVDGLGDPHVVGRRRLGRVLLLS